MSEYSDEHDRSERLFPKQGEIDGIS